MEFKEGNAGCKNMKSKAQYIRKNALQVTVEPKIIRVKVNVRF
jgi:hypothetical protein